MSTSLAEQLKRLRVPQTSILNRDKKRASLLFDPKEAAGLQKETVYQIGLEGLEELIAKNADFEEYRKTLFHVTSKDFERAVEDSDANKKLTKNINKFLLLLSPYFMLNSSHKVLEWLIHRYMINEYNREELLMLILPYHESNVFVRVLQLLQFKDQNDTWFFLKSLQRPGVHLPKQSLLNHAASSSYFLQFVRKFIAQLIKVHRNHSVLTVAFNFYCTVFTGTIEYSKEVTEDQVSQMLPSILKGLNSDIPDFCAASYVITARLVAKTHLSEELLISLVDKIAQVNVLGLKMEACLVLLVLYQSQKQYTKVPDMAVKSLSEKDWLPKILQDLNAAGSFIYPFLEVLVKCAVQQGSEGDVVEARSMVINLVNQIKLDDAYVSNILESILDGLSINMKYSEEAKNWLTDLVQMLERQYPTAFDKIVYNILTATSSQKPKRRKCLQKILKNAIMYRGKFQIFEKMYDASPDIRGEAIKFLKDNYADLPEKDKESIKKSCVDRLHDDNVEVVKHTLNVIKKTGMLRGEDLTSCLLYLANKCKIERHGCSKISKKVLTMLCYATIPNSWETFLVLFPYLLPTSDEELKEAGLIVNSKFFDGNNLLKTHKKKFLSALSDRTKFTDLMLATLQSNTDLNNIRELIVVLNKTPVERKDALHSYLSSMILSSLLPQDSSPELGCVILEIILENYQNCKTKDEKERKSITSHIKIALKNKFPVSGLWQCLKSIVEKTKLPNDRVELFDFSINSACEKFIVQIVKVLLEHSSLFEETLHYFLQKICPEQREQIQFLFNLCSCRSSILNVEFQVNALKYIKTHLDATKDLELENSSIELWILNVLCVASSDVRVLAVQIIEQLVNMPNKDKTGSWILLFEDILKHSEELILDQEQLPQIIQKLVDPKTTKNKKSVRKLNAIRNTLIQACCNCNFPSYMQANIMKLISLIDAPAILETTVQTAFDIIKDKPDQINIFQSELIEHNINRIDMTAIKKLKSLENNPGKFIMACLRNETTLLTGTEQPVTLTVLMLNQLNKDLFQNANEDVTKILLDTIIEIATLSSNSEVLPAATRIFKHMDLDANIILELLEKMANVLSPKVDVLKKTRRISVVPTIDILDTMEWRKGVTTLELIQDKKKLRNIKSLLVILFKILKKCLDFDEQAAVEYPKQLVLSLILHCCQKNDDEKIPADILEMPLIVQCIRASQNPQTHHHALLVLANVAQLIPNQVLQHMIPIFTFVGSSILRHDDAYSFQIIIKIIDTIVPILVTDNNTVTIVKVLRDFVDALLDVPEHRRMPLYKELLEKINVEENLYLFLLLVFDSHVTHNAEDKQSGVGTKRLDITANLCREFEPPIVIQTCIKLILYLRDLPIIKEKHMAADGKKTILNFDNYTDKQFRHFKFLLVTFTANLLSSIEFVNQVAALSDKDTIKMEDLYKEMIVNVLTYIQKTAVVSEMNATTPQAQYWKTVLHYSYEILDSTNALLTSQMFLLVTRGLMVHKLTVVRRRALELLNNKLQFNSSFFADCEKSELYALITPITSIIETVGSSQGETEHEQIVQIALLSLKLLVKYLASDEPDKFVPILNFITQLIRSGKAQNNVLASAVLCLAELCVNLRAHAISSLPDFMPGMIKVFKQQKTQEMTNVLLLSILTTIQKILDSLPLFLSPYLEKLLIELSVLMTKFDGQSSDAKSQPFITKLLVIKQKIGSVIPSRVLIPSIERCYTQLIGNKQFNAISFLMDVMSENLGTLHGSDVTSNLPDLTAFFLVALQFRTDQQSSLEEANVVEGHIIKAFTILILKLSESSFRPLYYKLFDWAVRNEIKSERLITFYSLSSGIAQSLKGLFVLFAGHFLNNAAQILEECNKVKNENLYFDDDGKNCLLLEYVLKTLNAVFLYDSQKFVNKDRFEVLMQPLVDQLENTLGGTESLLKRSSELLTPCLVHFALATADDALWKQMNYQILLKMRHDTPNVRLNALKCLTEVVKKLGEDFLPLLPETIPFLAELLEDEEESVEKACQKAVQEMEKVLGEPLQKYF